MQKSMIQSGQNFWHMPQQLSYSKWTKFTSEYVFEGDSYNEDSGSLGMHSIGIVKMSAVENGKMPKTSISLAQPLLS